MTTGERIKTLRKAANLSQEYLAKLTGYTDRSSIAKIEADVSELTESKIKLFAQALNTTPAYILGLQEQNEQEDFVRFNIIGEVAAGYDRIAEYEDDSGKVDIPLSWLKGRPQSDFFVLRVHGDSMFPMYQDGDIVLVMKQKTISYSGQIGVVRYDDDKATLKRIEYIPDNNSMKLVPVNPNVPPIMVTGEELDHCEILGIPRVLIRAI